MAGSNLLVVLDAVVDVAGGPFSLVLHAMGRFVKHHVLIAEEHITTRGRRRRNKTTDNERIISKGKTAPDVRDSHRPSVSEKRWQIILRGKIEGWRSADINIQHRALTRH